MREFEIAFVIASRAGPGLVIYRPRRRGVWGKAVMLTIAFYALLIVTALAEQLESGTGIICEQPEQLFEIYDAVTDDAGGWETALRVIDDINDRAERDTCTHSHLLGAQGPIVTGKTYPTARSDVQEVTIHARVPVTGGDWIHYAPPKIYYNGRLVPFVS
jgi:hypothetical protein